MSATDPTASTSQSPLVVRTASDVYALINSGRVVLPRVWLVTVVALGGIFVDFYDLSSFSIGADQLKNQMHLSGTQLGLLTAASGVGAAIGGLSGGYITDRVGRFRLFVLDLLLFVGAALYCALSPNYPWLLSARFLIGLGIGLDVPVALAFVAEYHAVSRKARAVNVWPIVSSTSVVLIYRLATTIYYAGAGNNLWRYTVAVGSVFAAVVLALRYLYVAESPMWMASQGHLQEAVSLMSDKTGSNIQLMTSELHHTPSQRDSVNQLFKPSPQSYRRLFAPQFRLRTIIITILAVGEAIEYFGVGFYTPTILTKLFGGSLVPTLLGSALASAFGIAGAILCMIFTQKIGMRRLGLIGFAFAAASLIILGLLGSTILAIFTVIVIGIFYAAHNFGPGTIPASMGTLSFPTSIRGTGGGYTQAVIRLGSVVGFYVFPVLISLTGTGHTVLIIAIAPVVCFLVLTFVSWDPVNRDIDLEDDEMVS